MKEHSISHKFLFGSIQPPWGSYLILYKILGFSMSFYIKFLGFPSEEACVANGMLV